jgi:5'-3' exonuclease
VIDLSSLKDPSEELINITINKNKVIESLLNDVNNIEYLLIDANCLIHPVCFKTILTNQTLQKEDLEIEMIKNVIIYLEKLIEYVNPKIGVYIAIDGVAPIAKIKQQRSRRFKSVADKIFMDKIKQKHNKVIGNYWNNNAITPGTVFMEKLHNNLLSWMKSYNRKIIYSSCLTPAEGEHKLLQFIRDNQRKQINNSYIIYGLDADLIFLALSTESDRIYLLREANEINKKESTEVLNYVSIKMMRELIVKTLESYMKESYEGLLNMDKVLNFDKIELNNIKLVNDFIFMCYFLGNDFLPHIPSLDIHQDGIEYLIQSYVDTINEILLEKNNIEYILNETNINENFLIKMIKKLSEEEEGILRENYAKGKKYMKCDGDDYEKEIFRIENLQFKINDPIKLGSDNIKEWRLRYYKHYWDVDENEIEEFSEKLVKNYLIGLIWITKYYFDKCPSWSWYYPYDHPPFISDISKYIEKININKIKFISDEPLKPYMQLLSVLPPQSSYLLPLSMSKLMTNPRSSLSYLYPYEFKQDFINKKKYWMGIPNLPQLDIKQVRYYYNKYKDELTKEEKEREMLKEIYYFKF